MNGLILGDNPFFGINHMSEQKAQQQAEYFSNDEIILRIIDTACAYGINSLMLTTHARVRILCDRFRKDTALYSALTLYPVLPYPHKYANAVAEHGLLGAIRNVITSSHVGNGKAASGVFRSGFGMATFDLVPLMKTLVDVEMSIFNNLNVRIVFLQNIATDLLLGLRVAQAFTSFRDHIQKRYGAEAGFITMNLPALVDYLLSIGFENPIVCSSVNKLGYLMNPDQTSCEATIRKGTFRPIAMSVLASGALTPKEAIDYIRQFPTIASVVFGASSASHVAEFRDIFFNATKANA